jgi:uncharacterized protein YbjT (DUF2867 family)
VVRALVTGATGLVGSRLAAQPVQAGHSTTHPMSLAEGLQRTLESLGQQRPT